MKVLHTIKRIILVAAAGIVSSSFSSGYSCDPEKLQEKHIGALREYKFVKSFPVVIEKNGEKSEYSYVLSKDVNYRILICEDAKTNSMILNVLDRDRKVLVSNFTKKPKTFARQINFVCPATGVYYLQAYYEDNSKGCGINILGYKK